MLRILLITPYYYPRIGGVETTARMVAREFRRRGIYTEIVTRRHDRKLKMEEYFEDVKIHRVMCGGFKDVWRVWVWMLRRTAFIKKFDLVYLLGTTPFIWYLPMLLVAKKPAFITYTGYEHYPIRFRNVVIKKISELLTAGCTPGLMYIKKYYHIRTHRLTMAAIENVPQVDVQRKKNAIVFAGQLRPDTGIYSYLRTLKILREKYKLNIRLDVFGDGKIRDELERFAKENKLNVKFFGFVPGSDYKLKNYRFLFSTPPQYSTIVHGMASRCLIFSICDNQLKLDACREIGGRLGKNLIIAKDEREAADKFYKFYQNPKAADQVLESAFNLASKLTWKKFVDVLLNMCLDYFERSPQRYENVISELSRHIEVRGLTSMFG